MNKELKLEIIKILRSEEQIVKLGSDGEYESYIGIIEDDYYSISEKICSLIQAITDPENQPNQYGIIL